MRRVARDSADPWIAEHQVIRSARDALDRVCRFRIGSNGLRGGESGKMASRREADHYNVIGRDGVIAGTGADQLNSATCIKQRNGKQIAVGTEPVAQHESAKA